MEKCELAANNGEHTGRSSYLCKSNKFRLGQPRKFQLKNNNQKVVQTSSLTNYSSGVSKDEN
jgi:hypothetical protein